MHKNILLLSIVIFLFVANISAQIIFEPAESKVYYFLERHASRGLIALHNSKYMLSRDIISHKLNELEKQLPYLTDIDKKNLSFYLAEYTEYSKPRKILYVLKRDANHKFQFLEYRSNSFYFNLSPLESRFIGMVEGQTYQQIWDGIKFWGYFGKHLGFQFAFRNIAEKGKKIDYNKKFNSEYGNVLLKEKIEEDHLSYDDIRVRTTYSWDKGYISIGKDVDILGYGKSGNIIKSAKAPAMPFFELKFQPVFWLSFNYSHHWLNSRVVDSLKSYPTLIENKIRKIYYPKYQAIHSITLQPKPNWDITIGESMIYADNLKFVYLQPLMFFRAADHYLSSKASNDAGDNAQIFISTNFWHLFFKNHFYFSLFIDEFSFKKMFSRNNRNQIAIQCGTVFYDFFLGNLDFAAEYVRINPFVYQHYIPTLTYRSEDYLLGHWIGANADLIHLSLTYQFLRGLSIKGWGEFIRKGDEGTAQDQYNGDTPSFLFGKVKKIRRMGLEISYEVIHNIFLALNYTSYKTSELFPEWAFDSKQYDVLKIGFVLGTF